MQDDDAARGFLVFSGESGGDLFFYAEHARRVLTNPNNTTASICRSGDSDDWPAEGRPARSSSSTRRTPSSPASASSRARAFPNVVVGRTFSKGIRFGGPADRVPVGAPATAGSVRGGAGVQRPNVAAAVAILRRRRFDHLNRLPETPGGRIKALLYDACDRLGLGYVKSKSNSCSSGG